MTLAEYEKKFTELAKYALAFMGDEVDKCRHFVASLHSEICTPVTTSIVCSDIAQMIEVAMRVEKSITGGKPEKEGSR